MNRSEVRVVPLDETHLDAASNLFSDDYKRCRKNVPELPESWLDSCVAREKLAHFLIRGSGLCAIVDDRLVGYLGWYSLQNFRDSGIQAAYVPEWAHAVDDTVKHDVYRMLYRSAAAMWQEQGVKAHVLSYPAGNQWMEQFWFWNGFGLLLIDAVRLLEPLNVAPHDRMVIRKAVFEDADVVLKLETEHWQHYLKAPVLMNPGERITLEEIQTLLSLKDTVYFLAEYDGDVAGMMKFEPRSSGATDFVNNCETIAITGAYVRDAYRGLRIAPVLLDAAIYYYIETGRQYCSVDFESFNPEAAAFWMKYFKPIRYSVYRVPETSLRSG